MTEGDEAAYEAIRLIQHIVHQKTAKTEPALHHFQRDFDQIRELCDGIIGPFIRATAQL